MDDRLAYATMEQTEQEKQNQLPETSEQFLMRLIESPIEVQVEELAALPMTITEIAMFTGQDAEELRAIISSQPKHSLTMAYNRGKMRITIMTRFDNLLYALHGSPEAMRDVKEYLSDQQIDENA